MQLKQSSYNVLIQDQHEQAVGIYNTSTGNFLSITDNENLFKDCQASGQALSQIDEQNLAYRTGFLIDSRVDELSAIQKAFNITKIHKASPQLTIAPTMDCNFKCSYCFESHRKGSMSEQVQQQLMRFLKQVVAEKGDHLSISWFGGEPLMGFKVIRTLSQQFLQLVDEGFLSAYSADIITNGIGLTPKRAEELLKLKVQNAQITIDGPRQMHNSRRILKGKSGETFDKIIDHIKACPSDLKIALRVNVDKNNSTQIGTMMEQFEDCGILPKVSVSLAPVENFSPQPSKTDELLSAEQFALLDEKVQEQARQRGWPISVQQIQPKLTGVCQVDSVNSFVIDPSGELLKCWAELGNKGHVVGHLLKAETWARLKKTDLTERDPFDDPECCSCSLLPVCLGSCPLIRRNNKQLGIKQCPSYKYKFSDLIMKQFANKTHIQRYIK